MTNRFVPADKIKEIYPPEFYKAWFEALAAIHRGEELPDSPVLKKYRMGSIDSVRFIASPEGVE